MYQKTCPICQTEFTNRYASAMYCSRECGRKQWKKTERSKLKGAVRQVLTSGDKKCIECDNWFLLDSQNSKRYCSMTCARRAAKRRYEERYPKAPRPPRITRKTPINQATELKELSRLAILLFQAVSEDIPKCQECRGFLSGRKNEINCKDCVSSVNRFKYGQFYKNRWPAKSEAHRLVQAALSHKEIIKPDNCSACSKEATGHKLHAHHDDYNKPLDIIWLCNKCHLGRHKDSPSVLAPLDIAQSGFERVKLLRVTPISKGTKVIRG